MFIIFPLNYFQLGEKKVYLRKNKKIYFSDPFIYNVIQSRVEGFMSKAYNYTKNQLVAEKHYPTLIENLVASTLHRQFSPHLYYGQTKSHEVDFVGKREGTYHYFEVKYQNQVSPSEFSWAKDLLSNQKLTVLSKNTYHEDRHLNIIPAELWLAEQK